MQNLGVVNQRRGIPLAGRPFAKSWELPDRPVALSHFGLDRMGLYG